MKRRPKTPTEIARCRNGASYRNSGKTLTVTTVYGDTVTFVRKGRRYTDSRIAVRGRKEKDLSEQDLLDELVRLLDSHWDAQAALCYILPGSE